MLKICNVTKIKKNVKYCEKTWNLPQEIEKFHIIFREIHPHVAA